MVYLIGMPPCETIHTYVQIIFLRSCKHNWGRLEVILRNLSPVSIYPVKPDQT